MCVCVCCGLLTLVAMFFLAAVGSLFAALCCLVCFSYRMWFCFPRCLVFVLYSYFVICSFPLQVTQLQTQKHSATAFRTAGVLVSTVPIYDEMSQCLLVRKCLQYVQCLWLNI